MKVFLFYFLLAILAMSIQATLFKGIKPDFVLILIYFYSLRYGQMKGMIYGALTGLLIDFVNGLILGPNIISKVFVGYLVSSFKQRIFQWNIIVSTIMVFIFSIIDIFLIYVCFETFTDIYLIHRPLKISIMQVVYTTIAGVILYPILSHDNGRSLSLQLNSKV